MPRRKWLFFVLPLCITENCTCRTENWESSRMTLEHPPAWLQNRREMVKGHIWPQRIKVGFCLQRSTLQKFCLTPSTNKSHHPLFSSSVDTSLMEFGGWNGKQGRHHEAHCTELICYLLVLGTLLPFLLWSLSEVCCDGCFCERRVKMDDCETAQKTKYPLIWVDIAFTFCIRELWRKG